jgi:hypothetical protein
VKTQSLKQENLSLFANRIQEENLAEERGIMKKDSFIEDRSNSGLGLGKVTFSHDSMMGYSGIDAKVSPFSRKLARATTPLLFEEILLAKSLEFARTIPFGWHVDTGIQDARKLNNKVRTARYTKYNWVPIAMFHQMKRTANIYFMVITLLSFVPGSPKLPYFSLLTLSLTLGFLIIKDG